MPKAKKQKSQKKKKIQHISLFLKNKKVFVMLKSCFQVFAINAMRQKRLKIEDKRRLYSAKWEVLGINDDKSSMLHNSVTLKGFDDFFAKYGKIAPIVFLDETFICNIEDKRQGHFVLQG